MFEEFKNKYLGKAVDVDGMYGAQCVDLFNAWNRDYNNTYINCRPSGFAKSIAENKANNGMLKYFRETAVNNMIKGTVVVYGNCKFAPDSHVCFFIKDNGDGTYQSLQQNANGRKYVTIDNNPYEGIIGAFIPNQIKYEEPIEPPKPEGPDQVIYKGSKVKFDGVFKVDILKAPLSSNLFGCTQLTGCTYRDYYDEKAKPYHWIPAYDFIECDANGNPTQDQVLAGGQSYVKNDTVYTVEEIDIPTNSAKLKISGKAVWVYSKYLLEV